MLRSTSVPSDESARARVAAAARRLYTAGPAVLRKMQHYRPYIAPFDVLVERMPEEACVLDIGCGGGLFLGLLAVERRLKAGFGVDADGQAIAMAQAMAGGLENGSRLRFERLAPGAPLPQEPGGGFDVVTMLDVLHHVDPPHQRGLVEQAIARVRPGGLFLYKDMAAAPRWKACANRLHDLLIARQWIHPVPLAEVVQWATAQGCTLREQGAVDMLWYAHEFVVFQRPQSPASLTAPGASAATASPGAPATPGRTGQAK